MIRIVGLGPSDLSKISVGAYRVLRSAPTVFMRTAKHPAAEELAGEGVVFSSMDEVYEQAASFDDVYAEIARRVLEAGDVVYAVPGHPLVGETAVEVILKEARDRGIEVQIIGSESFIEASLEALGIGIDEGLKIVDALSMQRVSPATDAGTLIYQVYDKSIASEVKLALMEIFPDEHEVCVVRGGAEWMPLYRLDRSEFDHLTSVYVPRLNA
ncbi:MAG: SAM-dependent methyltransferase [Armatimonadota bacterium]